MAGDVDTEDCVQITVQQYQCLSAASKSYQLGGGSYLPEWEDIMSGETDHFTWPCLDGWVGSLKFALLSSALSSVSGAVQVVDDGCKVYDQILHLFEKLVEADKNGSPPVVSNTGALLMVFDHQGDGSFKLRLRSATSAKRRRSKTDKKAQARRVWYRLAREAVQVRRTVRGRQRRYQEMHSGVAVKQVLCQPDQETDETSDSLPPIWKTTGFHSELCRTLGFVAKRMEEGGGDGDSVDWVKLHMDYSHHRAPLVDTLGKSLENYIMNKLQTT